MIKKSALSVALDKDLFMEFVKNSEEESSKYQCNDQLAAALSNEEAFYMFANEVLDHIKDFKMDPPSVEVEQNYFVPKINSFGGLMSIH